MLLWGCRARVLFACVAVGRRRCCCCCCVYVWGSLPACINVFMRCRGVTRGVVRLVVAVSSTLLSLRAWFPDSVTVAPDSVTVASSHVAASASRRFWGRPALARCCVRQLWKPNPVILRAREVLYPLLPVPAERCSDCCMSCERVCPQFWRRVWWEAGSWLWRRCGPKPHNPPVCSLLHVTLVLLDRRCLPSTSVVVCLLCALQSSPVWVCPP